MGELIELLKEYGINADEGTAVMRVNQLLAERSVMKAVCSNLSKELAQWAE